MSLAPMSSQSLLPAAVMPGIIPLVRPGDEPDLTKPEMSLSETPDFADVLADTPPEGQGVIAAAKAHAGSQAELRLKAPDDPAAGAADRNDMPADTAEISAEPGKIDVSFPAVSDRVEHAPPRWTLLVEQQTVPADPGPSASRYPQTSPDIVFRDAQAPVDADDRAADHDPSGPARISPPPMSEPFTPVRIAPEGIVGVSPVMKQRDRVPQSVPLASPRASGAVQPSVFTRSDQSDGALRRFANPGTPAPADTSKTPPVLPMVSGVAPEDLPPENAVASEKAAPAVSQTPLPQRGPGKNAVPPDSPQVVERAAIQPVSPSPAPSETVEPLDAAPYSRHPQNATQLSADPPIPSKARAADVPPLPLATHWSSFLTQPEEVAMEPPVSHPVPELVTYKHGQPGQGAGNVPLPFRFAAGGAQNIPDRITSGADLSDRFAHGTGDAELTRDDRPDSPRMQSVSMSQPAPGGFGAAVLPAGNMPQFSAVVVDGMSGQKAFPEVFDSVAGMQPASTAPVLGTTSSEPQVQLPRPVVLQIIEAVNRATNGPVEVHLNPEELGKIKISMSLAEAGISVSIVGERLETIDLMRRHIDQLAQEFRNLGYGSINFSFSHQDQARDHKQDIEILTSRAENTEDRSLTTPPANSGRLTSALDIRL